MGYGKRRIKTLAEINRIHYEPRVSTNYVNYMGIDIPKIKVDIFEKEKLPSYSFQDTPVDFDDTVDLIKQSFNEIMKLAELDYVIFHFAFNYQKIQRRIRKGRRLRFSISSTEALIRPRTFAVAGHVAPCFR